MERFADMPNQFLHRGKTEPGQIVNKVAQFENICADLRKQGFIDRMDGFPILFTKIVGFKYLVKPGAIVFAQIFYDFRRRYHKRGVCQSAGILRCLCSHQQDQSGLSVGIICRFISPFRHGIIEIDIACRGILLCQIRGKGAVPALVKKCKGVSPFGPSSFQKLRIFFSRKLGDKLFD